MCQKDGMKEIDQNIDGEKVLGEILAVLEVGGWSGWSEVRTPLGHQQNGPIG